MVVRREGPGTKKLEHLLIEIGSYRARVGWPENTVYPDGTPVAYVATIHEFGTTEAGKDRNVVIPPRPFMRPTVDAKGSEWMDLIAKGAKRAMKDGTGGKEVLEKVAIRAAGDVGKTLQAVTSPALSPLTVRRKGHSKPLIDTGTMFQTLTGIVESSE